MIESVARRWGYPWRPPVHGRAERILARLGHRLIPTNRRDPDDGPAYAPCPRCGLWHGLWIERGGATWTTTCGCWRGRGDLCELLLFVLGSAR